MPIANPDLSQLINVQQNVINLRNFVVNIQQSQPTLTINWTPIIAQLDGTINLINAFVRANI